GRASSQEKLEIAASLREWIQETGLTRRLDYVNVDDLEPLDRQFLTERQLISREHAGGEGNRGVAFPPEENISLMINEEDHLRIQVMRSGMALEEAWEEASAVDDALEERMTFAFHHQLGYLTACPTNVGTGLRASVMLHLPALVITKQIEKVFRALHKINLAVRGLYGEGSQASGDFYQISNQVTLGSSEAKIIQNITAVVPQIIHYEREARNALRTENRQTLHDRVARSLGILRSAHSITSEETMHHLSNVRMGINLGLIDDLQIATVNELFIHTQPAHLQKLQGEELDSHERNIARATYLRNRLRNNSDNHSKE
ncbi:MAG: protein arginine kinase, partial [Planctomycetes bacterium]|nr:protein arginine kinase [Planctomycetota bacterium]